MHSVSTSGWEESSRLKSFNESNESNVIVHIYPTLLKTKSVLWS